MIIILLMYFLLTEDEDELFCGFLRCPPLDDLCFILFELFTSSLFVSVLGAQGINGREREDWLLSGGLDLELAMSVEGEREGERENGKRGRERGRRRERERERR